MTALAGRRILLGVTGSIAAIKAPIVARELMRRGARVSVAMTPSAERFTTALAMSALTREDVITEAIPKSLDATSRSATWHIDLARSADAMLIAPCSATTLGKLASGIYDNAVTLLASALPSGTPLIVAPAMDEEMWLQAAVQENIRKLESNGVKVIQPTAGPLASGLTGTGRMLEPPELIDQLEAILGWNLRPLSGKTVLITGGPTYEPIDPVRFLGNRSTGKMAAALASVAHSLGASVTAIMGPGTVSTIPQVKRLDVNTALEMLSAVELEVGSSDIIIMSAAVSDFKPAYPSKTKLKKRELDQNDFSLELQPTPDILGKIAKTKKPEQLLIGFALELGEKADEYALGKLAEKNLDMIVLNRADVPGAGFGTDTNQVTLFLKSGTREDLPMLTKEQCARKIMDAIVSLL